jgi:drug/metabolite transporter (DMT)-like permease
MKFPPPVLSPAQIGWAAAAASVLIGVCWQLSTRAALAVAPGQAAALSALDVMLIRYGVPALLLLPLSWREGLWPSAARCSQWGVSRLKFGVLMGFGGLIYGVFSYVGARFAPVAHMGALVPGTIPVFLSLLAWWAFSERPSAKTWAALACLLTGSVLVSTGGQWVAGSNLAWLGDLLFLCAAFNWAVYTLALRGSRFNPLHLVGLVAFWNAPVVLLAWLVAGALGHASQLASVGWGFLSWQLLIQGVVAAIGGNYLFLLVVRHLGAATAAGTGAAVPAGVAIGGVLVLNEALNTAMVVGVCATVLGIWAAQVWARKSPA